MVRIHRKLDSETLHLPELKPLIGKTVEIIIKEEAGPEITAGTGDWDAAEQAIAQLQDYDYEALHDQRECDLKHARDHIL